MRSISLILKQFSRSVLLIAGLAVMGVSAHAQGDAAKGEALFKGKCSTCHKLDVDMTGPALGPVITSDTDDKWLTSWIRNNKALIAAGDAKAVKVYKDFQEKNMTIFEDLSNDDVAGILAYVRTEYPKLQAEKNKPQVGGEVKDSGPSELMVFALVAIVIVAFIIILVLNKAVGGLERLLLKRKGLLTDEEEAAMLVKADRLATIKQLAKNKKFLFFFILCSFIALSVWQFNVLWNTNVHQGYQPVQPIKYSHELHAGTMKIDCQYCHSGAYKSKNASIPSLNICMNCHKAVKTESPEIHKIYDALGYDPKTTKYDSTKAKPIQWVRVHNLPDLVYFNHSQHVKVGKIICQDCHGPIQTMKEVYQYSPLTMKWCIQCHKRTAVDTKGNAYYTQMASIHDRIKKGDKVTEKEMGGLECGKCHY